MEIRFLGIGSAYNTAWGNNNAYFRRGEDLCLLDCGEASFHALRRRGFLEDCRGKIIVLLTHCHADHAGSLASLCSYGYYKLGKKIHVVHPDKRIVSLLGLMGIPEDQFHYHEALEDLLPGITAQALPVIHVADIPCYGYLLCENGAYIYYSGDAGSIPDRVLELLRQGALEKLYQDTCWAPKDSPPSGHHLSLYQLEEIIPPPLRNRVYCMHFNTDYRDEAKEAGFSLAQPDEFWHVEE